MRIGRRLRIAALLLVALSGTAALSIALLGSGAEGEERAGYLPGNSRAGAGGALSQVPEADCTQWRRASPQQRSAVVVELGARFGRDTRGGEGASLPGDYAHEVLERACSQEYATNFKLWKIYEKALGFQYDRSVLER